MNEQNNTKKKKEKRFNNIRWIYGRESDLQDIVLVRNLLAIPQRRADSQKILAEFSFTIYFIINI